jgi:hypothetical protein
LWTNRVVGDERPDGDGSEVLVAPDEHVVIGDAEQARAGAGGGRDRAAVDARHRIVVSVDRPSAVPENAGDPGGSLALRSVGSSISRPHDSGLPEADSSSRPDRVLSAKTVAADGTRGS